MGKLPKWIIGIAGAVVAVWLFRTFLITSYTISSQGMENTLQAGDRILVNKWSYGLRLPFASRETCRRWRGRQAKFGDIAVFNNPAKVSEKNIGGREVLLARCLGMPGDTLIQDAFLQISSWEKAGPDRKSLFAYPAAREAEADSLLAALGIIKGLTANEDSLHIRSLSRYEYYLIEQTLTEGNWIEPFAASGKHENRQLVVPRKGMTIDIRPWNAVLYHNTIVLHEGRQATLRNDSLYVEGQPVDTYTFTKDYYWMSSDNSVHVADSRIFGFVPHDHLVGKAVFLWFSRQPGKGLFGGYRWNRAFSRIR